MKYIFYLTSLFFLPYCNSSTNKNDASIASKDQKPINTDNKPITDLKKYDDVIEMIEDTGDFSTENGTLKLISQKPLHIQLAKIFLEGELESNIQEDIKRNIVYVGFRIFAQTSINEIEITSLPLKYDSKNSKIVGYVDKYKKKMLVKREKATSILEKYYGHSDFTKLFGKNIGDTYVPDIPNQYLTKMMYGDQGEPTLETTFNALK